MLYTFEDVIAKDSECNWKDISKEKFREYRYPHNNGVICVHIEKPIAIDLRKSGGHIVIREDGRAFYIAPGWITIEWENKPDVARAQW